MDVSSSSDNEKSSTAGGIDKDEDDDDNNKNKDGDNRNDNDDNKMDVDSPATPGGSSTPSAAANTSTFYELTDSTLVDLTNDFGKDLCCLPELLFTDELPFADSTEQSSYSSSSILDQHPAMSNLPLHKLIHASLSAVGDVDIRKDLASSILPPGGCSRLCHLEQRLSLEVPRIVSGVHKCKVLASRFLVERSCGAWIGGSILMSLGSFQQLWRS
jgi:actin-related protein